MQRKINWAVCFFKPNRAQTNLPDKKALIKGIEESAATDAQTDADSERRWAFYSRMSERQGGRPEPNVEEESETNREQRLLAGYALQRGEKKKLSNVRSTNL